MRIHECVIPSCRICRLFVCINMSKIARQTPFPFVDDAKVRTKKMRLKEFKRIMEVFRELWN